MSQAEKQILQQQQQPICQNQLKTQQAIPAAIVNTTEESDQGKKYQLSANNNSFTYQYQSIADRMLRQLEDEYWQVQKHNIGENKKVQLEKSNSEKEDEEEQQIPEGYVNLDHDNQNGNNLNSESQENSDQSDENAEENKNIQVDVQVTMINTDISNIGQFGEANKQTINPETKQLVEVGPVPDSIFEVPQPQSSSLTEAECGKIKSFALSLDIEAPEWANDPAQIQQKIRKLFQNPVPSQLNKQSLPKLGKFTK